MKIKVSVITVLPTAGILIVMRAVNGLSKRGFQLNEKSQNVPD